ncbi:hypothetical protein EV127DRAFT_422832 [Xylaria flabelliformis]|nr:hypothetical protein EV127DRAFT_422832 [Xylaria flabelliformis]
MSGSTMKYKGHLMFRPIFEDLSIDEALQAEDVTVHYAACAIGWVVLKGPANRQPEEKPEGSKEAPADRMTKPYVVEFSRDKAHHNYLPKSSACKIRAIDDGGLDLVTRMNVTERTRSRVVLLEAKAFTYSVRNRRNAASEEYARRRQNDGFDVEYYAVCKKMVCWVIRKAQGSRGKDV